MIFHDLHNEYSVTVESFKQNIHYVIEQSKRRKMPVQIMDRNTCVALLFTEDAFNKWQTKIDQLEKRDQEFLKENKQLRKKVVQLEVENDKLQTVSDHIKDIRDTLY